MLISPVRTNRYTRLGTSAAPHNVAVFATYLATFCRFCHPPCRILPFLPPITPSVKLPISANRLEFSIRAQSVADHNAKSGKNGNVDCRGQLSWPARLAPLLRRQRVRPQEPRHAETTREARRSVWAVAQVQQHLRSNAHAGDRA